MTKCLKVIESKNYLSKIKKIKNPYGDGKSGIKIAKQLLKIKLNTDLIKKRFINQ